MSPECYNAPILVLELNYLAELYPLASDKVSKYSYGHFE